MKYYLYTFSDKIDNFKVEGFKVLTQLEKDMELSRIRRDFKNGNSILYGNDDEYEYETLREVLKAVNFKEISFLQYNTINLTFGGSFGNLGPLDTLEEEEEQEERYCDNCGETLEDFDEDLCEDCQNDQEEEGYENEYNSQAARISTKIKQEYNIEESSYANNASYFNWKPTNKTQLEIAIVNYDESGDDDVQITLKVNNRGVAYESFSIDDAENKFSRTIKVAVEKLLSKAKSY